ncbi:CRE-TTR-6 protein [Aphelenchoides avenae]|nr:CRE-TTR-6 protein [Aphelenchus avenae]
MHKLVLVLAAAVLACGIAEAKKQTVGARGRLICGNKPAPEGTEIKLWLKKTARADEVLAEAVTEANGDFSIQGTGHTLTPFGTIDTVIKVYHNCNNADKCKRKYKKHIPAEYVADGQAVKQWYEMQNFDLSPNQPGEEIKCD